MTLMEWVNEVKATGGVPEGSQDTLAALRAASALCWAEIDQRDQPPGEIAQRGVKWVAAFMVSCARHDATSFGSILTPSDYRQRIVHLEAQRNDDAIAELLHEAAAAPRPEFDAALLAAGAHGGAHPPDAAKAVAVDRASTRGTRRKRWLIAVAVGLLLVAAIVAFPLPQDGTAWRVIDGDTLDLAGERIRLFGIDAPERGQRCGRIACGAAATDALADILAAGPVRCTRVSTDRYGRTVARCRAGRRDVNREMVRRGMAWAYRQYGDDYVGEEKAAKKARVGIWKYTSQPAWEYRANKRK